MKATPADLRPRLSPTDGQMRAVSRMLEHDRHCIDFAVRTRTKKTARNGMRLAELRCRKKVSRAEAFPSARLELLKGTDD